MEQVSSLRTEDKFKKTEAGEIPVEWEIANLEDVAQINMGQSPPSSTCFEYENGLPFFQGKAEFDTKYPKIGKWCNSPTKIAEQGDILISVRAPVGDVNIAPVKCCIGRGLAAIRGVRVDNDFLYFLMYSLKDSLAKIGQGSTFEAINKNVLFKLAISLPPVLEQKKIAEILSTVDSAIEKSAQVIEKTKELKKGLMQELLTRGIGHKKFKKTKIGEIPGEWEVIKLSELSTSEKNSIIDGDWIETKDQSNSGYRLLQIGNIGIGKFNLNGKYRFVSEETINRLNCKVLQKEDLLISRMPDPIGRACLMEDIGYKCITVVDCTIVKINKSKVYPLYIVFFLNSENSLKRADELATGTTRQRISRKQLEQLPVALPSLPEQKQIAEILSSVDEEIEKEVIHKEKLENIKRGLMQTLLTGKVRVKI